MPPVVEAKILELRRLNPGWGPRTILSRLARENLEPLPSRSAIYRALVRHQLIYPSPRRRRPSDDKRWEGSRPMELWQMDVTAGVYFADGSKRYSPIMAVLVVRIGDRSYWQFQNLFYCDNDGLSAEEIHTLLVTRKQRDRARIEGALAMVTQGFANSGAQRGSIPDDVKQFVWTRDGGQCRSCAITTELQYDHVIPVALGGASSAENLQILCGPCNRRKGARLTAS